MTRPHIVAEYELESISSPWPLLAEGHLTLLRFPFQVPWAGVTLGNDPIVTIAPPCPCQFFGGLRIAPLGQDGRRDLLGILPRPSTQNMLEPVPDPILPPHPFVAVQHLHELTTAHDLLQCRAAVRHGGAIHCKYYAPHTEAVRGVGVRKESLGVYVRDADEPLGDGTPANSVDARGDKPDAMVGGTGGGRGGSCPPPALPAPRAGSRHLGVASLSCTGRSSGDIAVCSPRLPVPVPPFDLAVQEPPTPLHSADPQAQRPLGLSY
mmetsp:Transcript_53729/g.114126  ORF Transcript_53729/g.114126 Transcript_53729/m.114126 type:complete len:265 (-) Transcript_53729:1601-2395(-)